MNLQRLYLDYNATSPLSKSVLSWLQSGDLLFANPSSQHSDGKASRKLVNEARSTLFETFGQEEKTSRLFFQSGATEAFHTFAHSFAEYARQKGAELLICFSVIDHPAVTSLRDIFLGTHVKFFELQRNRDLDYCHEENFQTLLELKTKNPDLIILYHHLWVHNETGFVSPLHELSQFKKISDLYIHVDAVQAPGKIPQWDSLPESDIWSFSSHKFGALKGVGFSFFKSSLPFYPMISGGGQQQGLRSGTENIHGIKSTALALEDLKSVDPAETLRLRESFLVFLKAKLSGIGECLEHTLCASNTIYFFFYHYTSDIALALFDVHGIEISAGSACSSGAAKESLVLLQMGRKEVSKNGLRISLPLKLCEEELDSIKDRFEHVFAKLKASN